MERHSDLETIFVSIASYRDTDCGNTIDDLFAQADDKDRVFIGLCQQNDPECPDETAVVRPEHSARVRMINMHRLDARGPTFARYLCSTLHQQEKYYFQIDSHMRFVAGWDTKLVTMQKRLQAKGDEPVVVSTYPTDIKNLDGVRNNDPNVVKFVPLITKARFDDSKMIRFMGAQMTTKSDSPTLSPFVAAGFLFAEAMPLLRKVPFDPYLDDAFSGEEVLLSARLYTHGFNVFAPNENIAFHNYIRKDEPKFWENRRDDREAVARINFFLKISTDIPKYANKQLDRYSAGTARTLDQYWRFAGINWTDFTTK